MGINRQQFFFSTFLFNILIIFCLTCYIAEGSTHSDYNLISEAEIEMNGRPSESGLPDKVYTFDAPSDILTDDFDLENNYIYYIYIELVTPNNVSMMRIRIWDPDGKLYNIFESEMYYNPEYGRYFEIPFGTAISGVYTFEFYTVSNSNFNLYIQITKGPKCLYDKIDPQDTNSIILYDVKAFTTGESITEDNLDLKSDFMYKFYIGRVSAITIAQNNEVYMDCSIEDPEGTIFELFNFKRIEDIDGLNMFLFGTASKGEYNFKLTIYCNVNYVNIAYIIVEDYQIAEGLGGDEKEEKIITLEDISEDIKEDAMSLPAEWMIGTLCFIGAIAGFALILLINQKKMNTVSLNIREK